MIQKSGKSCLSPQHRSWSFAALRFVLVCTCLIVFFYEKNEKRFVLNRDILLTTEQVIALPFPCPHLSLSLSLSLDRLAFDLKILITYVESSYLRTLFTLFVHFVMVSSFCVCVCAVLRLV